MSTLPINTAILVPADIAEDHRTIYWDTPNLLAVLIREMDAGDRTFDYVTVVGPGAGVPGGLRLWSLDDALLIAEPEHNDRAITLCRHLGYMVPDLAGPIVFLGAVRGEDEAGLHPTTYARLDEALAAVTAAGRRAVGLEVP